MAVNFRLPGPTPLPPPVLAAMQRPMIPHRGPVLQSLYRSIMARLREIHQTSGHVFTWPATGSAGWETAIVNMLSPGDAVLAVVLGDFGDRAARVCKAFGLDVRRLDITWGRSPTPDDVRAGLEANPDVTAVFIAHNETSTGVTVPLAEIAAVIRDHGALVVVDAVSSAGGLPLRMDDWGLDFVLSGSQKAWMCPPGLMIAGVGPRCWDAVARSTFPRFFLDLTAARKFAADGMTPTTPPLTHFYALDAALDMMLAEGIENVWARHARLASTTRNGLKSLGLQLFADESVASNTVTAVHVPAGVGAKTIMQHMREHYEVELQGGQAHLADAMLRIGHMGWVHDEDIDGVIDGLRRTLIDLQIAPSRAVDRGQPTPAA